MNRFALMVVGSLLAAGCGNPVPNFGGDLHPVPLAPLVVLVADANRNGTIDFADPTETTDKTTWNAVHGAIMLANIDDDQSRCVSKDASGRLLPDTELLKCNDGADTVINGESDLLDLAPLGVQAWPYAPDGMTAGLAVDAASAPHVHLFIKRGGAFTFFDWTTDRLSTDELRAGATLAIEATDIVRDRAVWDGFVTVTLSSANVTDAVKLRVAPVITQHHLATEKQVYVSAFAHDPGSVATRASLKAAIDAVKGANASATFLTEINAEQNIGGAYPYEDQWTQDYFEIAYMSMPTATGAHVIDVFYRSANVYYPGTPNNPLRDAGKVVFAKFRGPDSAGISIFDLATHNPDSDSLNSYGNLETIPPFSNAGKDYPQGRLFRGNIPTFGPDPAFEKMLEAQALQPPVYVDTSWLLVGHVDETISFVKAATPRGWVMLVNDAALARTMLQAQVTAGNSAVKMFTGEKWVDDNNVETPAEIAISDVLAKTDVMSESSTSAAHIDSQVQILKAETGLTDAEIIHIPYLHEPVMGVSLAYQPGTVNGLYFADDTFAAPDPHGPQINGVDIFKTQMETALGTVGVKVKWVEDWDLYHRLAGEVHCGTNSRRNAADQTWWTSGR